MSKKDRRIEGTITDLGVTYSDVGTAVYRSMTIETAGGEEETLYNVAVGDFIRPRIEVGNYIRAHTVYKIGGVHFLVAMDDGNTENSIFDPVPDLVDPTKGLIHVTLGVVIIIVGLALSPILIGWFIIPFSVIPLTIGAIKLWLGRTGRVLQRAQATGYQGATAPAGRN